MDNKNKKTIVLSGGGTGGSVTPLLGIVNELKNEEYDFNFLWLGTKNGPEKEMVIDEGIEFKAIMSGKLRRYFSIYNFIDPIKIFFGFIQSLVFFINKKPDFFLSAGSFVSVPAAWAAWLLKIPVLVHQQDARPGLANKLMAPIATIITVTLRRSLQDYGPKAELVGNSVRKEIREVKVSSREARQKLGLNNKLPVVLIMGGGTGAEGINKITEKAIVKLTRFCQVLHITGKGKISENNIKTQEINPNYRVFEFLDAFGMIKVYSAADIVVSRAGMSSLTELSYLRKPSIIIPIPMSHQEENAQVFRDEEAAFVFRQESIEVDELVETIKLVLKDEFLKEKLSNNIEAVIRPGGTEKIVALILEKMNI